MTSKKKKLIKKENSKVVSGKQPSKQERNAISSTMLLENTVNRIVPTIIFDSKMEILSDVE